MLSQEKFIEDIQFRNAHIGRVNVLNKVKVLSLLPDDEYMAVRQTAEYYDVEIGSIRKIVQRHKDELLADGLKILSGKEFASYKSTLGHDVPELYRTPSSTLLNRRCILRIGMLLRDSEIAKQVRTYLLNVEVQTTQQQKSKAAENSSTFEQRKERCPRGITTIQKHHSKRSEYKGKRRIKINFQNGYQR